MIYTKEHRNPPPGAIPQFSIIWLIGALVVLAISGLHLFPVVMLATLLSDDQFLTPVYVSYLQCSQWIFAILALFLWPLTFAIAAIRRTTRFILHDIPDAIFLLVSAALSFGSTLLVQTILFQGIPHVTDAISHLFQAKIFALGKLWAPAPLFQAFFPIQYLLHGQRPLAHGLPTRTCPDPAAGP